MAPRFHLFVSNVDQQNEGGRIDSRLSCMAGEMERLSLDLMQAAKNKGIWDCLQFVYGLRVTLAKSRIMRGASHLPASMGSCLTISQMW